MIYILPKSKYHPKTAIYKSHIFSYQEVFVKNDTEKGKDCLLFILFLN